MKKLPTTPPQLADVRICCAPQSRLPGSNRRLSCGGQGRAGTEVVQASGGSSWSLPEQGRCRRHQGAGSTGAWANANGNSQQGLKQPLCPPPPFPPFPPTHAPA